MITRSSIAYEDFLGSSIASPTLVQIDSKERGIDFRNIDFRNVCQKNQTYYRIAFLPPATQKTKNPIKQN